MQRVFFLCFCLVLVQFSFAQVKAFDKLEMLYDQGHFKAVLHKSKRLLDQPDYDFSILPLYYKSLAQFRLVQNDKWYRRHPEALEEASMGMKKVLSSSSGGRLTSAHKYEIKELKVELYAWGEQLKIAKRHEAAEKLKQVLVDVFSVVPNFEEEKIELESVPKPDVSSDRRTKIVAQAKEQIGVPYLWAGTTPKGFDCSGFTTFVFDSEGVALPRRAADQFVKGVKKKRKDVLPGDLIFFNNGRGISHVGIVVSNPGEPLLMIHASSSKGITITNVDDSKYWRGKIAGFSSYLN